MKYVEFVEQYLESVGFRISKIKEINYGNQLVFSNTSLILNLYDTQNISIAGKTNKEEKQKFEELYRQIKSDFALKNRNDLEKKLDFNKKIISLIDAKEENENVDYKRSFKSYDKNFLKDILSMANNLSGRDSYLIYGVDDDCRVIGLDSENDLLDSAKLNDWLVKIPFADNKIPGVELSKICYLFHSLNVITIKNEMNVPYFLDQEKDRYKAHIIYYRYGDTNQVADYDTIRKLWEINLSKKEGNR